MGAPTKPDGLSAVRFLLWMGAARADANAAQTRALRDEVLTAFEDGASEPETRRMIRRIMGPRWKPGPDWDRQIRALSC